MWWEEAALAAGSSFVIFFALSTHAALRLGRSERFPITLQQVYGPRKSAGRSTRNWRAAIGYGVLAVLGQGPVLVVAQYRWDELGLVSRLLLGGELVAAFSWVLLLWMWVRSSSRK